MLDQTESSFITGPATTEIYTLSLHDALPISASARGRRSRTDHHRGRRSPNGTTLLRTQPAQASSRSTDRKSTRLNSSHGYISYAVFCLKNKNGTKSN